MKTPLTNILTLFLLYIIGFLPKTSAIHPIPLRAYDRTVEHFEIVDNNTPITEEKDIKNEKSLSKIIVIFTIIVIVGVIRNAYCRLVNLLNGNEDCGKFPVGIFMFSASLLVLIRNKFTRRYWRRKKENEQRRIEREKWLEEDIESDEDNDEDDGIIIF